ncbi:hypothetical protein Pmi06nite_42880 [Planotetraspora mira]|uniref:Uncharacterized protein n=1 Tax=Planotetraspora mira TaxID=58121 RepID=A0A8J3X7Z7_9ACTN|nr:hypothetical protein Pmi06nite_42880 [Planotetraspora mira]
MLAAEAVPPHRAVAPSASTAAAAQLRTDIRPDFLVANGAGIRQDIRPDIRADMRLTFLATTPHLPFAVIMHTFGESTADLAVHNP